MTPLDKMKLSKEDLNSLGDALLEAIVSYEMKATHQWQRDNDENAREWEAKIDKTKALLSRIRNEQLFG